MRREEFLPIPPLPNVPAALDVAAESDPDTELIFIGDDEGDERQWPYARLRTRALEVAAALTRVLGVAAGARVALVLPDPEAFVPAFFGVLYAGGVPVPIYPPGVGQIDSYLEHCRYVLGVADVAALVTSRSLAARLGEPLRQALPGLRHVIAAEDLQADAAAFRAPQLSAEDLGLIQFTSGSTARPKGVALTHGNLVANSIAIMGEGLRSNGHRDRGVSWLPLYHDMGLIGFVVAALVGRVPVSFIPTTHFLRRPAVWLRVLSRHRGTITYAPNFAYALAARRVRDEDLVGVDLSSLRVAGCGAEPIQAETLRAFARRYEPYGFRVEAFVPSYGMAESSLGIAFGDGIPTERIRQRTLVDRGYAEPIGGGDPNGEASVELVGCGKPFSGHELRIVEPATGEPCQPRHAGEILVSGPSVTAGYFRDPERTHETIDADGWLHTGDLGYLDEDGQVFVCGRLKDLIIVNGRNFYPQDLEWAASRVDGVRLGNVVAFGVSSRDRSSEAAVVVAESKLAARPEARERLAAEIRSAVQRSTGLFPDDVLVVRPRTIPKTTSGKVQRARARRLYETGLFAPRGESPTPTSA